MFAVVYVFHVNAGMEQLFISAWSELTTLIKKYEGGLGSRLHRGSDNRFIAYAQWPSKAQWENSGDALPKEAIDLKQQMKQSCASMETLFEMDLVKDLLTELRITPIDEPPSQSK